MSATACWTLERSPAAAPAAATRATTAEAEDTTYRVPIEAAGAGLILHDLLFSHTEEDDASSPQSAAVFGGSLKDTFELIRSHLRRTESSRDKSSGQQQQRWSKPGCVLFLTAYTHHELQDCIKDESSEWQSFAKQFCDETVDGPRPGMLSFMDQVQIRHLPTPKHLFALLALTEVSLPITQELPSLLNSRLVLIPESPAKANAQAPQNKLSKGSKQTCLPAAPSLVILHGLSRWFRAGVQVEQLVSAISHSLLFCNDVVPALRRHAAGSIVEEEEDDGCAASLLWFDDAGKSGEAQAQDMKSVLDAVAKSYFDTVVRYEPAPNVDTAMQ